MSQGTKDEQLLPSIAPAEVRGAAGGVDAETLRGAAAIVEDVRARGAAALREHAERLGDVAAGAPLVRSREELAAARDALDPAARELLERTATRIAAFARAQRDALAPLQVPLPGGAAGHEVVPVEAAGCYAPGGRFPLPSSVLMTAVTARAAGVARVWVASPRPTAVTLAAAAVAGADGLLTVGGAQAIAALAFGVAGPGGEVLLPPCDAVVGPGNRWVTAAKQHLAGAVAIDLLAGPSELVVLACDAASPRVVAADLIAQAEHDPDARPFLVTTSAALIEAVRAELAAQLATLPTADTARPSLTHSGGAVLCADLAEACEVVNRLAPEHLELHVRDPDALRPRLRHYGALFLGAAGAEVLGDYGAGPNHVLPTGGTARSSGGLSVLTFLRVRTWLRLDDLAATAPLLRDAAALARLEGLEGHARAAEARLTSTA